MQQLTIPYKGVPTLCRKYDLADEPQILDVFFFWKTAVLLAEKTSAKKPQMPETFSEPFCCLVCDLVHKPGSGVDAFRLSDSGEIEAAIEIKATITTSGFTDLKRDLNFDELYWLSLADYNSLSYKIHKMTKEQIERFVAASNTNRDRGTVNLAVIAQKLGLRPVFEGRIGIIRSGNERQSEVNTSIPVAVQQRLDISS